GYLLDELVDLRRLHIAPLPVDFVGQQLVAAAASVLQLGDDLVHGRVDDRLDAPLAALGDEVERHHVALDADVSLADRRQPVVLVLLGVALGADAEEAEVQQTHRARQHAVAVEVRPGQPLGALAPDCGESAGELEHVVELLAVAPLPPGRVVQVLPAPGGVGAHGLQMAVLVGADPYVGPRRRDGQRPDAGDRLSFGNARPVAVQIHEPSAGLAARETRVVAGHTAQTGHGQTFARSHTRQNAPRNAPGAQEPQPKAGAPRFWQGVLAKTTP